MLFLYVSNIFTKNAFISKIRANSAKRRPFSESAHLIYLKTVEISSTKTCVLTSVINELLERGRRKQNFIIKLMNENNKITEKSSEISNTLNDYFINVGPNLNAKTDNCQKSQNNHMASKTNSFFFQPNCANGSFPRNLSSEYKKIPRF